MYYIYTHYTYTYFGHIWWRRWRRWWWWWRRQNYLASWFGADGDFVVSSNPDSPVALLLVSSLQELAVPSFDAEQAQKNQDQSYSGSGDVKDLFRQVRTLYDLYGCGCRSSQCQASQLHVLWRWLWAVEKRCQSQSRRGLDPKWKQKRNTQKEHERTSFLFVSIPFSQVFHGFPRFSEGVSSALAQAARRVLSTLLASQLESLLRQTFGAWHAAKAEITLIYEYLWCLDMFRYKLDIKLYKSNHQRSLVWSSFLFP